MDENRRRKGKEEVNTDKLLEVLNCKIFERKQNLEKGKKVRIDSLRGQHEGWRMGHLNYTVKCGVTLFLFPLEHIEWPSSFSPSSIGTGAA